MVKVKCNDNSNMTYHLKDGARVGRRFVRGTGVGGERIIIPIEMVVSVMRIKEDRVTL